jgi:hypothetical protein
MPVGDTWRGSEGKQMHVRDFSKFANTETTLSCWPSKICNRKFLYGAKAVVRKSVMGNAVEAVSGGTNAPN